MAKNSAKSKGYRKTIKKKPFLTKKEIIELVVILAVILIGVILFNVLYDDGFTKNVQPGEVVSYASDELRDRYKKLADIGEVEGFTLEERGEDASPISLYNFLPDDEASDITSISVSGSFMSVDSLIAATRAYMEGNVDYVSDPQAATIQGYDAQVFSYSYGTYDPAYGLEEGAEVPEMTAEEIAAHEPNKYSQNISAYIAVDEAHTLCFHIYRASADESFYLADEELLDYVAAYESAFTLVEKEA